MPYRFKPGESVAGNVKRIITEELGSAVERLTGSEVQRTAKKRDEAIHEARKSIKKIRGILKLIRFELRGRYRRANTALRDIGRNLSDLRDASAIIETFGGTVQKHENNLRGNGLASIRKGLERDKREKEKAEDVAQILQNAATALNSLRDEVAAWELDHDGFEALSPGLKETYRRGRKAMRTAARRNTPEYFHEWRKRAKDHWYHVRLLESLWTDAMKARETNLHDLESWLGDDHNLLVLQDRLSGGRERYGDDETLQLFNSLAAARQRELRADAMSLGERLYEEKPRQFVAALEHHWAEWQKRPASMKSYEKKSRKGASSVA